MAFVLYGAPLSPFVRKVMYLLAVSKAEYKLKVIVPGSVPDDFVTISPLKRIPVLQDHDFYQADSSIVCNYLIETLGHDDLTQLIPANAQQRAHMRWLEKFADYELAPWLTFVVFRQRVLRKAAGKTPNEERIHEALSVHIPPLLDYLTQQLGSNHYFVDNRLSLADIAITSQMVNFMHGGEHIDKVIWPQLSDYFERMQAMPIWHNLLTREQATLDKIHASIKPKAHD
ncbi:MAG: glutathione S-transferase family protein [Oceanospirillaceae bacterium]|nr:glutathione S-transferase family protein [Oceanospirillaceae bacterium]